MKSIMRGILLGIFLVTGFAVNTGDASASSNCPFTAGSNGTVVNFEDSIGRLYSTGPSAQLPHWKTFAEMNLPKSFPAGEYKISLASYDEYANRVNVTQINEKYYVIFKNSGGGTVGTSGTSGDIADRLVRGTWNGPVGNVTLSGTSTKVRVQHAKTSGFQSANSLYASCMLIEPVAPVVTTPSIDNGSCIVGEQKFLRYGESYPFTASVKNNASKSVYLTSFYETITNAHFLDKGGDFEWTSSIRNANYKVNAGASSQYARTAGNWKIDDKPSSRTNATSGSYDFKIQYNVKYSGSSNGGSEKTSKLCNYYSVTYCGDGVRDAGYEICDPNDSSETGFGNAGCSNTCEPINVDPVAVCDSLNVDTQNVNTNGTVHFTCGGQNVESTRVSCGNGGVVNQATGQCSYPHAGTYTMVCTVTGGGESNTSNACKKTINVTSTANPAIKVDKTALDGTDMQTVGSSTTARFTIKVTNVGDEDLDRNIVLSDPRSPQCAGTLVLPNNHPTSFANFAYFGDGNHSNQVLEPGEGFSYTCEISGVTADFTNIVSVNGTGVGSNRGVSDTDPSEVQMQQVSVEIPSCPYSANGSNSFVVDLREAGRLWSKEGQNNRKTLSLGNTYNAGNYKISLFAADAYQSRVNVSQPREIIKINLKNGSSTVATSHPTSDVPDYVAVGYVNEVVNNSLAVSGGFNSIEVVHAAFPDNSNANSVQPVCALIEEITDPVSACPFTASENEIVINLDEHGGRLYSDGYSDRNNIPKSFTFSNNEIAAGSYMVFLAADDGYSTRSTVTGQHNETIKVIFQNGSSQNIATSNASQDVPDGVNYGIWSGMVNANLVISQDVRNIKVMHGAPGSPSAESVNPLCLKLKRNPDPQSPSINIDKTDDNQAQDIDTSIGNDTQTILVGHTSRFKITVTNDGTEPLKNIVISDELAPQCAGTVILPNIYPSSWSNFAVSGNNDTFLDPGEAFSYTCERAQTLDSYTNTASVNANGKNTNGAVDDTDTSRVIVDTNASEDICPYTPTGDQILIDFNDAFLGDWKDEVRTRMFNNFGTIPAGRYRVSLASFDGYKDRSNVQPEEQYYVAFVIPGGAEITQSSPTEDIRDDSNNASWYGVVNDDLLISEDIQKVTLYHVNQEASGQYNSLKAKCMLLDPIGGENSEPEIAIVKEDANADDLDGDVYDTQTVAPNGDAVFKIKVTNTGTEDLENIVITDALAPACAGSVTLPNTKPSTFENFVSTDNGDAVFNPGETFEYTCKQANTSADYVNIATVDANGVDSDEDVTDTDPSTVKVGGVTGPSILIDKTDRNLDDFDGFVGDDTQTVSIGDDAEFKITVENNGTENLTNIVITDELAPACAGTITLPGSHPTSFRNFTVAGQGDWFNDVLEPGEIITYTCIQGDTPGAYTNTAGVTATGETSGESVDDDDTSEVILPEPPEPSIAIDKRDANPEDVDLDGVTGNDTQSLLSGDTAVFKIRVRNNGPEALENIEVTDALAPSCSVSIPLPVTLIDPLPNGITFSAGGTGNYDDAILEPGEWVEYTCEQAGVEAGYTNSAEVTATGVTSGEGVTDTDTTEVVVEVVNSSIRIVKTDANPADIDGGANDTQTIPEGGDAAFRITVINNGNTNLTNIVITDELAPNCAGSVTLPGTYPETFNNFSITTGNEDAVFNPGERFTFTCVDENITEGYENTASVEAEGENGEKVDDDDTSTVLTEGPSVSIDKTDANDDDLDGGAVDTQTIASGDQSTFRITVRNNGTEDLDNIVLTDALAPNCGGSVILPGNIPSTWSQFTVSAGNAGNSILRPGESFSYVCSKPSTPEAYTNTINVDAQGVDTGEGVTDEDDSEVLLEGPSISIDKTDANSADLDGGRDDTQTVNSGDEAVFRITVTNTGTENLENIVITDDRAANCAGSVTLPDTFPGTFSNIDTSNLNGNARLNPGESFSYTCTAPNTTNAYRNIAGVTASGANSGESVDDTDGSDVKLAGPEVTIDKTDANSADIDGGLDDTQTIIGGENAIFRITVTNTGTEDLENVVIADTLAPNCAGSVTLPNTYPTTFSSFDATGNDDTVFNPGESFSYTCIDTNVQSAYTNTAGVTAEGTDSGESVTDEDDSDVVLEGPSINVDKTDENGDDLDGGIDDTQEISSGGDAVFRITIVNNGTEDLNNIVLEDEQAANCAGSLTLPNTYPSTWTDVEKTAGTSGTTTDNVLSPGERFSYVCTDSNVTEAYRNIVEVTATSTENGNEPVNDDDGSDVELEGPELTVDKTDDNNAEDTDGSIGNDSQTVELGDTAVFKITVTNTGAEGLTNITIVDAIEASCAGTVTLPSTFPSTFDNVDTTNLNDDNVFDPGESFSYNCSKTNTTEEYTNTVEVEGTGVDTGIVTKDTDTTEVELPEGLSCTGITVEDNTGTNSLDTDVTCSGVDVEEFVLDCGNGQVFTGAGNNSGSEEFTRQCNYDEVDTYFPTCTVDGETNNTCQDTVRVKEPGGSSGGSSNKCIRIEIDDNASATGDLTTDIRCFGSNGLAKMGLRLSTDSGVFKEISTDQQGDGSFLFEDVNFSNNLGVSQTIAVSCGSSNSSSATDIDDFEFRLTCQDSVSLGAGSSGGGSDPVCGNGIVETGEQCEAIFRNADDYTNGVEAIVPLPSNTCDQYCQYKPGSSSGGSSGGGAAGFCGDGVLQKPNSLGVNEECERVVDPINGDVMDIFPPFCNDSCKVDLSKLVDPSDPSHRTDPSENAFIIEPSYSNVLIGHGQDPFYNIGAVTMKNTGKYGRLDLPNVEFCLFNQAPDIIKGSVTCESVGSLLPGHTRTLDTVGRLQGDTSNMTTGFKDGLLSASLRDNDGEYPNGYFARKLDVRVAKPSVATTGGGLSLVREETVRTGNTTNLSDVQVVANAPSQTALDRGQGNTDDIYFANGEDNTNFQGASISEGNALSSSADEVNNSDIVDQATEDNVEYQDSVDSVETSSGNDETGLPDDNDFYNGIENVYSIDGNLTLGAETNPVSEPTTYIVNGDLIIDGNITSETPIAFIVKGGDIQIDGNVTKLDGTFVTMGGKLVPQNGNSDQQLVITGGVYGDTSELVQSRTYISNQGGNSGQISVGTIIRRGASLFSETPPLLRSFINEYTEEQKVAQ